jgi:hypothetical protein
MQTLCRQLSQHLEGWHPACYAIAHNGFSGASGLPVNSTPVIANFTDNSSPSVSRTGNRAIYAYSAPPHSSVLESLPDHCLKTRVMSPVVRNTPCCIQPSSNHSTVLAFTTLHLPAGHPQCVSREGIRQLEPISIPNSDNVEPDLPYGQGTTGADI